MNTKRITHELPESSDPFQCPQQHNNFKQKRSIIHASKITVLFDNKTIPSLE